MSLRRNAQEPSLVEKNPCHELQIQINMAFAFERVAIWADRIPKRPASDDVNLVEQNGRLGKIRQKLAKSQLAEWALKPKPGETRLAERTPAGISDTV
jgi:hypothetical protein